MHDSQFFLQHLQELLLWKNISGQLIYETSKHEINQYFFIQCTLNTYALCIYTL